MNLDRLLALDVVPDALIRAGIPAELHLVGRVGWGRHAFLEAPPPFLHRHGYLTDAELRANAEAIDKIYDEVAPTPGNVVAMITREAAGVVACVVPWNFPLLMACWKISPALAAGNSVILKPAEQSPLTAIRYQIVVVFMLAVATALGSLLFVRLAVAQYLTPAHPLRRYQL